MEPSLKILIIEDNPVDAEIIRRLLTKEFRHAEFDLVANENGFLKSLTEFVPDVILSDNSLPQFSAADALELSKKLAVHTPFILVTGTVSEEYAAEVIKNGADDYILKDRMARLPAAIESAATKRQAAREKEEYQSLLAQSQENLQAIFDNTSDGFVLLDSDLKVKAFNNRVREGLFLHINPDLLVGQPIFELVQADRWLFFESVLMRVMNGEYIEYDKSYPHPDGSTRCIHFSFNPVRKDQQITGICITSKDITARKEGEERLKKSFEENKTLVERVSAILNTLPANIGLLDEWGMIIDVNDSWRNFDDKIGFIGKNYGIGANYITVAGHSSETAILDDGKIVAAGVAAVLSRHLEEFVHEYACDTDTEKRWFRMIVTPLSGQAYRGAVVMHIDISEIKRLEQERLERRIYEQRRITRAILNAQEKERNAIAIELHDNVNQILVGTNLLLSHARLQAEKNTETIMQAMENLQQAIIENRKIAHEFVAPDLDTKSLSDQLRLLFGSMLGVSGISILFNSDGFEEQLLDCDRKFNIYRIAQEQCTNIVKYAKATEVRIRLFTGEGLFKMSITDNGVGMNAGTKTQGIGIRNIKDRLSLFNGSANITTSAGKGFELEIVLSLSE